MDQYNQYKIDALRFSDLLSKYTGISKSKIDSYLNKNPVNNIFEHTASLNITKTQQKKLEELRELRNIYDTMKIAEEQRYKINSYQKAGEYFKNYLHGIREKEYLVCAFLDNQNKIITTKIMTEGSTSESAAYPREIAKEALLHDASAVIISHNHPSASNHPSPADIDITKKIQNALYTISVELLDHIIIAGENYYSFAYNNQIKQQGENNYHFNEAVDYVVNELKPKNNEDMVYMLESLSKKGISINFNKLNFLSKDIKKQYELYKNELSQLKNELRYVNKTKENLENALKDYQKYTEYINKNKGILKSIIRIFNKNERNTYKSLLNNIKKAKNTMVKYKVYDQKIFEIQKNVLSKKQLEINNNINKLSNKMNILSKFLQEIARCSSRDITPTVKEQRTQYNTKSINFNLEIEVE